MAKFNFKTNLQDAPFELNLAEYIEGDELEEIGRTLKEHAEHDRDTRKEWMDTNKDWLKLAAQTKEDKNYPWPGASNVKYPLLTIAAMQFHARALPSLIPDDRPVKAKVFGQSMPDTSKQKRADRVSAYMSFQVMDEQEEWLDEMDRMLFVLPMVGICYKKSYYSGRYQRNKSEMLLPNEMYINYYAKNFEGATKTHAFPIEPNALVGLQRQGIYLDCDLGEPEVPEGIEKDPNARREIDNLNPTDSGYDTPYLLYEMECWLDLDDDGFKEPYFVTLDSRSGKVLRIAARWAEGGIKYNGAGDVVDIADISQVTPYIFLPDPASATSGIGLGHLLGPTNEAVNTLTNQLIDAGTLSNMQGGFLAKGLKLRKGATRFRPGEWKSVATTGDDLRKSIVPMPVQQPSSVLFELLGLLINSGEKVGSVTEMMTGQNPGQNQKATTSMAVLEQGMKVFSSIYKRIYRSMRREFQKFYTLNFEFLDDEKYNTFFDPQTDPFSVKKDFNRVDMDVLPAADPSMVTDSQKLMKSQALLEKLPLGTVNVQEATKRALQAEGQEDVEQLMTMPPAQPSIEQQQLEWEKQKETMAFKLKQSELQIRAMETQAKVMLQNAQADKATAEANSIIPQQQIDIMQKNFDLEMKKLDALIKVQDIQNDGKAPQQGNSGTVQS